VGQSSPAGWVRICLALPTLPRSEFSHASICELYTRRWEIELFYRLGKGWLRRPTSVPRQVPRWHPVGGVRLPPVHRDHPHADGCCGKASQCALRADVAEERDPRHSARADRSPARKRASARAANRRCLAPTCSGASRSQASPSLLPTSIVRAPLTLGTARSRPRSGREGPTWLMALPGEPPGGPASPELRWT